MSFAQRQERYDYIKAQYKAGIPMTKIAVEMGVTHQRIQQIVRDSYAPYERIPPGDPIPELEWVAIRLNCLRDEGRPGLLSIAEKQAITYRYAEGLARTRPMVTAQCIALYLDISERWVLPLIKRKYTSQIAQRILLDKKAAERAAKGKGKRK